jgi:hypothetical protein
MQVAALNPDHQTSDCHHGEMSKEAYLSELKPLETPKAKDNNMHQWKSTDQRHNVKDFATCAETKNISSNCSRRERQV